jgi:hypothetical protein
MIVASKQNPTEAHVLLGGPKGAYDERNGKRRVSAGQVGGLISRGPKGQVRVIERVCGGYRRQPEDGDQSSSETSGG